MASESSPDLQQIGEIPASSSTMTSDGQQEFPPSLLKEAMQSLLQQGYMMAQKRAAGSTEEDEDSSASSARKKPREDGETALTSDNEFLSSPVGGNLNITLVSEYREMQKKIQAAIETQFPNYKWVSIIIRMPALCMQKGRRPPCNLFTTDAARATPLAISWGDQLPMPICIQTIKKWCSMKTVRDGLDQKYKKGFGDPMEGSGWAYTKAFSGISKGMGVTNVVMHTADDANNSVHLHVLHGFSGESFNGTQMAKALTQPQLHPFTITKHRCRNPGLALMNHMEPRSTGVWLGSNTLSMVNLAQKVYESIKLRNAGPVPEWAPMDNEDALEDEPDEDTAAFLAQLGHTGSTSEGYQVDNICSSKLDKFNSKQQQIFKILDMHPLVTYSLEEFGEMVQQLAPPAGIYFEHMLLYQKEFVQKALDKYTFTLMTRPIAVTAIQPAKYSIEDVANVMAVLMYDTGDETSESYWEVIYFQVISVLTKKHLNLKKNTVWISGPTNYGKSTVFIRGLQWIGPIAMFQLAATGDFQFGTLTYPHVLAVSDDPSGVVLEPIWPALKCVFGGERFSANEKYARKALAYASPVLICSNHERLEIHPARQVDIDAFNSRILYLKLGPGTHLPKLDRIEGQQLLWKWAFVCAERASTAYDYQRSSEEFYTMLRHVPSFMAFVSRICPGLSKSLSSEYESIRNAFFAAPPPHDTSMEGDQFAQVDEEDNNSLRPGTGHPIQHNDDFICDIDATITDDTSAEEVLSGDD